MKLVPKNVLKFIKLLFNEPASAETNERRAPSPPPSDISTDNFYTNDQIYAERVPSGRYERGFRYGG